jgi:hypothetical protein
MAMNNTDEGLGLSIAVYALAMLGGLALFALPVYWATSPTVYENPGVTASRLPGGPAYANHPAEFPLAVLKREQIVDQKMLAELSAKSEKRSVTARTRSTHRSYAQARDTDSDAHRPTQHSFFSLF